MPADSLYALLPEIVRERDERLADGLGSAPLRDLLSVIQEEIDTLNGEIEQLYDDWFIETCAPWVVPYLADLIGRRLLRPLGPQPRERRRAIARARLLAPRRDVANTVAHRRRKGTLHLLEDISADVAAWPARAVESYRLLGWDQHLGHLHPDRGGFVPLRDNDALVALNGPFDRLAHRVDVRDVSAERPWTQGRWNITGVAVHVWRLGSYPITRTQARAIEGLPACFTFSALGNDAPLFARPEREPPFTVASEQHRPVPITRHALARDLPAFYGRGRSLLVEIARPAEHPEAGGASVVTYEPVDPDEILVTSLRRSDSPDAGGWPNLAWPAATAERPRPRLAIDPETGRLMFPPDGQDIDLIRVSYRHGFSAPMGGGEYQRSVHGQVREGARIFPLGAGERFATLSDAVAAWHASADPGKPRMAGVIEIMDSEVYDGPVKITVDEGESLWIRARAGARPVIRSPEMPVGGPEGVQVDGAGCFILDGILIEGRGVEILGDVRELRIRHCTLVPGRSLDREGDPTHEGEASLRISARRTAVTIADSIVGPVHVEHDELAERPFPITVTDSILDAHRASAPVVRHPTEGPAHAILDIRRTTVLGRILAHAVELGEDSIFLGGIEVERRQVGCLRFSYVPDPVRTPSRFRCQPETAIAELAAAGGPDPFLGARVVPRFTTRRFGQPGYAQLRLDCADEIREGASDEAEMGAFHDLYQPQRIANLRERLQESTPAAMDVGPVFAT